MDEAQKTTKRWQHTAQPYLSWYCKTSSLGHQTLCSSAMFLPANHDLSSLPPSIGQSLNGLSHPSIRVTQKLLMYRYVWHSIRKQVGSWVRSCKPRQVAKILRQVKALIQTSMYHTGDSTTSTSTDPLLSSQGYTHLLTMVDQFAKWPEAIPLKQTHTECM